VETPKPAIDKADSRRILAAIRRVLVKVWDPIGVQGHVNLQDEYDGYIGQVYKLLVRKASQADIVDYLYWAAHDNMGLDSARRSDMTGAAEALTVIPLESSTRNVAHQSQSELL